MEKLVKFVKLQCVFVNEEKNYHKEIKNSLQMAAEARNDPMQAMQTQQWSQLRCASEVTIDEI